MTDVEALRCWWGRAVETDAHLAVAAALSLAVASAALGGPAVAVAAVGALCGAVGALVASGGVIKRQTVDLDGVQMIAREPRVGESGVYWLRTAQGLYKIGMSDNGAARLKHYRNVEDTARTLSERAVSFDLEWWTPSDQPRMLERSLHRKFKATNRREKGSGRKKGSGRELFERVPGSELDRWLSRAEA